MISAAIPVPGKKSSITRRRVKNDRLNHAGYLWAFAAITASPGAKVHYRRRRDKHGDWHASALRHLFNRMVGQLPLHAARTSLRRGLGLPDAVGRSRGDRCMTADAAPFIRG
ncbi:hypothetical protein QF035_003204 [Streptomyces umbrinus]|uniref:Transposase n=1 Tax=Streptomyces umbrinus TaxID=67370 RepID=A0ABU0SQ01_9ACTN|nr:hypothetical protein [Streptomyces umbrinus]